MIIREKRFIVFEGLDGCGKTTQLKMLDSALRKMGCNTLCTREPGGTGLGEKIRLLLLDPGGSAPAPAAEAMLFGAARAQHVAEIIEPALGAGTVVLADRFTDSTLAYQGYGRGINLDFLQNLNTMATGGIIPGLTVLLDIAPEAGLARLNRPPDRMEMEHLHFFGRVRRGYLDLAAGRPQDYLILDAAEPPENIHRTVLAAVERLLGVAHD